MIIWSLWNKSIFIAIKSPKKLGISYTDYSVCQENRYSVKNMLLLKNPQFLPNHYEILSKWGPHRNDLVKIMDFQIKAYFSLSIDSPGTHCMYPNIEIAKPFNVRFNLHCVYKKYSYFGLKQKSEPKFTRIEILKHFKIFFSENK